MSEYEDLTPIGEQLDRRDLRGMTQEEITAAHKDGRLNRLLMNGNYQRDRGEETHSDGDSALDAFREYKRFNADPKAFIRDVLAEGPPPPKQLTRADLQGMSPYEIDAARKAGQLKDLLAQ